MIRRSALQIVMKAVRGHEGELGRAVSDAVGKLMGSAVARSTRVAPLFPEVASGNRSLMFVVEFPRDIGTTTLNQLVDPLVKGGLVEYAERPQPRKALGS